MSEINLDVLAEKGRAQLLAPGLTLQGRLADALDRFAGLPFPTHKKLEAAREIESFITRGLEIVAADDRPAAARLIGELGRRGVELTRPPIIPTAQDQVAAISNVLAKMQWSPLEMDLLIRELKSDEAIIGYDRVAAHTNAPRTITRRELREKYRPITWSNTQSWNANFRDCPIDEEGPAAELPPTD